MFPTFSLICERCLNEWSALSEGGTLMSRRGSPLEVIENPLRHSTINLSDRQLLNLLFEPSMEAQGLL